jgi:purine-nucleoside phosphorylase
MDTPARYLRKILEKKALGKKILPAGQLFLLDNQAVLYGSTGAPLAVMGLEILIVSGIKEIFVLGFCGSLRPDFSILNVVSIQNAYSEEGTSRHYFPRKRIFSSDPSLRRRIEEQLSDRNLTFRKAKAVSTDAPFRETRSWLLEKQKKGTDVVDMEVSAVFALARFYRIRSAALMIVSDELTPARWKSGFQNPRMADTIDSYFLPFMASSE